MKKNENVPQSAVFSLVMLCRSSKLDTLREWRFGNFNISDTSLYTDAWSLDDTKLDDAIERFSRDVLAVLTGDVLVVSGVPWLDAAPLGVGVEKSDKYARFGANLHPFEARFRWFSGVSTNNPGKKRSKANTTAVARLGFKILCR